MYFKIVKKTLTCLVDGMQFIVVEDNVPDLNNLEGAQGDGEPEVDEAHDVE